MDKNKQPGIDFKGIILVEDEFWRDFDVPDESNMELKFEAGNSIHEEEANVEITATLKLTYKNAEVLRHRSKFVGLFSIIENEKNMNIEMFIKNNAPALMFPYIREHISSVTGKSGINPIVLPPINLLAILNAE